MIGIYILVVGSLLTLTESLLYTKSPTVQVTFITHVPQVLGSNVQTICAGFDFLHNRTIIFSKHNPKRGKFFRLNINRHDEKYQVISRQLNVMNVTVAALGLIIKDADDKDDGVYMCTVNDGIHRASKQLTINIQGPPRFLEEEEEEEEDEDTAVLGESYQLDCEVRSFPPPTLKQWLDESGNIIKPSGKYKIKTRGKPFSKSIELMLTIVTLTDLTADYTCVIGNQYGIVNKTFTVTAKPFIDIITPMKTEFKVGDEISFICVVIDNILNGIQIQWKWEYKESPPLLLNDYLDVEQRITIDTVIVSSTMITSSLFIWQARLEDQGRYICSHQYNESEISAFQFIAVTGPPQITSTRHYVSSTIGHSVQIVCNVTSRPPSIITWYHHNQPVSHENVHVETTTDDIYVTSVLQIDLVRYLGTTYECKATNEYGTRSLQITTDKKKDGKSEKKDNTAVVVGVVLVILVVAVVVAVVFILRKRRRRSGQGKMPTGLRLVKRYNIQSRNNSNHLAYENDGLEIDPDDFPRCRLKFVDRLGEGKFGKVLKAEALSICQSGKWETVAVKMWKDTATDGEKEDFYHELMIVKKIPHQQNVVKFLGTCKARGSEPVLMIMEFMSGGDLLRFLRNKRTYYNQIVQEKMEQTIETTSGIKSPDLSVDNTRRCEVTGITLQPDLSPKDLLCYSHQIAKGMNHIASLEIVHRDVAARNILISDTNICKVSDFGLARDVEGADEYEQTTKGPLPIRWMSPEALRDNVHSTKSDVWAYGVCLWEIATFGASPYPGKSVKMAMDAILSGERLECPRQCKQEFFDVMDSCWARAPGDRPGFGDLVHTLENLLESEGEYMMLDHFNTEIYCVLDNNVDEKL